MCCSENPERRKMQAAVPPVAPPARAICGPGRTWPVCPTLADAYVVHTHTAHAILPLPRSLPHQRAIAGGNSPRHDYTHDLTLHPRIIQ